MDKQEMKEVEKRLAVVPGAAEYFQELALSYSEYVFGLGTPEMDVAAKLGTSKALMAVARTLSK